MFSGNVRRIATVVSAEDNATGTLARASAAGDETADSFGNTASNARMMRGAFLAAGAATTALVSGLAALTAQHGQTEQTFARMAEVSGATSQQMGRVTDTAKEIGSQLPISMGQAASAMEQLSFAGFSTEESMNAARGAANLATASTLNMSEAARTTGSLLNAFNLEADQTAAVTGSLSQTFSSSAANIRELNATISRVAPAAQSLGISFQETAAAAGVLADRGQRGSRAATALRNAFSRITEEDAQETLSQIGVSMSDITDENGQLRNLDVVLQQLSEGFNTVDSEAQRAQLATELVGRRGRRALLPLLDNVDSFGEKMRENFQAEIEESIGQLNQMNDTELSQLSSALDMEDTIDPSEFGATDLAEQLTELRDEGMGAAEMEAVLMNQFDLTQEAASRLTTSIQDQDVSAQRVGESISDMTTAQDIAAAQMDTTAGAITFLKSSLDTMAFTIFEGASPAIQALNEFLASGINTLNSNEAAMKAVGSVLVTLTGAFAALTGVLGAAFVQASVIPQIMSVMSSSFLAPVASAGSLSGALSALGGILSSLLAPLLAAVAVIGTVVTAFQMFREAVESNFLGVGDDLNNIVTSIQDAFTAIQPLLSSTADAFVTVGQALFEVAATPIVGVLIALVKATSLLVDVLGAVLGPIVAFLNANEGLRDALGMVIAVVGTAVGLFASFSSIVSVVATVLGPVVTAVGAVASGIGTLIGVLSTVISVVGTVVSAIGTLIAVLNPVSLAVIAVVGAIVGLIALLTQFPGVVDTVTNALGRIPAVLSNLGSAAVEAAASFVSGLVNGIRSRLGVVTDAFSLIRGVIQRAVTGYINLVTGVGQAIVDVIVSGVTAYVSFVTAAFDLIAGVITDAVTAYISLVTGVGQAIVETIVDGVEAYVSVVQQAFGLITDVVENVVSTYIEVVTGVGSTIIDVVVGPIQSGVSVVRNAFASVRQAIADVVENIISTVAGVGQTIVSTIADGISSAVNTVVGPIRDVASAITDFLPFSNANRGPLSNIMSVGGNITSAIASGLRSGVSAVSNAAGAVAGAVSDALGGALNAAKNIAGSITDSISGAIDGAVSGAQGVAGGVASGITNGAGVVADAAGDMAQGVRDRLPFSDAKEGPLSDLTESGEKLMTTIARGVQGQDTVVQSAVSSAVAGVAPAVGGESSAQTVAAGIGSDSEPPATPQEVAVDTDESGSQKITVSLSVEQDITFNSEDSIADIRAEIEQMIEQGGENALRQLERRITSGEGLGMS